MELSPARGGRGPTWGSPRRMSSPRSTRTAQWKARSLCTMRHEIPCRRPLRIKGYDYTSEGAYFVTICARQRRCVFGDVLADAIVLSRLGQIVHDTWRRFPSTSQTLNSTSLLSCLTICMDCC